MSLTVTTKTAKGKTRFPMVHIPQPAQPEIHIYGRVMLNVNGVDTIVVGHDIYDPRTEPVVLELGPRKPARKAKRR